MCEIIKNYNDLNISQMFWNVNAFDFLSNFQVSVVKAR